VKKQTKIVGMLVLLFPAVNASAETILLECTYPTFVNTAGTESNNMTDMRRYEIDTTASTVKNFFFSPPTVQTMSVSATSFAWRDQNGGQYSVDRISGDASIYVTFKDGTAVIRGHCRKIENRAF
jgi:hypothetical protein